MPDAVAQLVATSKPFISDMERGVKVPSHRMALRLWRHWSADRRRAGGPESLLAARRGFAAIIQLVSFFKSGVVGPSSARALPLLV
jgi:hypothetical protein